MRAAEVVVQELRDLLCFGLSRRSEKQMGLAGEERASGMAVGLKMEGVREAGQLGVLAEVPGWSLL